MGAVIRAPEPRLVVVDASTWVSSLVANDINHGAAKAWLDEHISTGGQLVAPTLLVVETASALARVSSDPSDARSAVAQLYSLAVMRLVPLEQVLVDEAADIAVSFRLKGADSFYVAVARQLDIPLVTFDTEQLTRPAGVIDTIDPRALA